MTILTGPADGQFPDNSKPENRLDLPDDLKGQPFYRSFLLTGLYMRLMMAHFCDHNNLNDPVIRNRLEQHPFTEDDQTGLLITTVSDWRPTTEETRPAILINRGPVETQRLTIGDQMGQIACTGEAQYITMLGGHHVLFAIAGTSVEADRLAFEVSTLLLAAQPILVDQLDLQRLQLISIGEASQLEESKDNYAVPIVMAYKLQATWSVQPHVPVLKRILPIVQ